jgi:glucose/arabinose dehydrogenase
MAAISMMFLMVVPVIAAETMCAEPAPDQPLPAIALQEIAAGFHEPVHIANAGDGSGRLYVVEQEGVVRMIENGKMVPTPFLDIRDKVKSGGERGLLSIAFHPHYRDNGYFYVNYTERTSLVDAAIARFKSGWSALETVVSRFKRDTDGNVDPDSETVLLTVSQPWGNHNGGQLAFGPDGYLYIGMGDGGAGNDPHGNGQDQSTLLGAMLRIDVDHEQAPLAYTIPADNPFVGNKNARGEIWAYGLRNPWRFSFDRQSGRLFAADVGQNTVEEIDVITRGKNYGWNIMEGDICTPGVNKQCDKTGLEPPIFTYRHPEGFSVTGGFVYRGTVIPGLCGAYLFGDFVKQRIWGLRYNDGRVTTHKLLLQSEVNISSFGEDEQAELYIAAYNSGKVMKIVPAQ